jgi:hypothetical protein
MKYSKIIIWGYPLHSHTHSYIHAAFYKAFTHLGYETYWFHDGEYPDSFDWNDCVFWTEGFADKNIPLNKTSTYFVHVCPDPAKYINAGVKKFVDVRYNHLWHKDHVYDYTLDKSKVEKVGDCCYLQPKKNCRTQVLNDYHQYWIEDYDKFYVTWATNILPEEFDFEDINYPRENKIYFSGNISPHGRCENYSTFKPFIDKCVKNGVEFINNNPFANPLSEEEVILRTKKSILGVDIRGPEHIRNGYVPCRVFKSISWGHLGTTNSEEVYKELEGHCIYQPDTSQMFYDAMNRRLDTEYIKQSMLYVKENHTYVNRIKSIMSIV